MVQLDYIIHWDFVKLKNYKVIIKVEMMLLDLNYF